MSLIPSRDSAELQLSHRMKRRWQDIKRGRSLRENSMWRRSAINQTGSHCRSRRCTRIVHLARLHSIMRKKTRRNGTKKANVGQRVWEQGAAECHNSCINLRSFILDVRAGDSSTDKMSLQSATETTMRAFRCLEQAFSSGCWFGGKT